MNDIDNLRAQGLAVETVGDILGGDAPVTAPEKPHMKVFRSLLQGSDEWLSARCGMLTASEMKHIVTPTLKVAANDKTRGHLYELLAQRITGHVEPHFVSDDMLRGQEDEIEAVNLYNKHFGIVDQIGFITNWKWGFMLGYSPDGIVGDDGLIECKSRRQKYQVQTIIEYLPNEQISAEYMIQVQTGLLVSERKWCDLVSYSGGLPMTVVRVFPDERIQTGILEAAASFEAQIAAKRAEFDAIIANNPKLIPTERRIEQEMYV